MSGSSPQTLQDFLVSIRYQTDEASQRKADTGLKNSTFLAIEAGKAFIQMAKDAWQAAHQVAEAFDALYFVSKRTGATIESLKALGYAARQAGIAADSIQSTIESISKMIATNPAGENFLNQLGITTRDANGKLLETGRIVENLGRTLRSMPLPQANVVAGMLGIDYKTLLAMREGLEGYANEYRELQQRIHLDSQQAGADANKLASSMRSFGTVVDVVGDKIKAQFTRDAARGIQQFRNFVVSHFDDINRAIMWTHDRFVDFMYTMDRLATRSVEIGRKVIGWFNDLDETSKRLIEAFAAIYIAWNILNSAFARSPIGRILLLGTLLVGLIDDFRTFREGGEHAIPWEKIESQLNYIQGKFAAFRTDLGELGKAIRELGHALGLLGGDQNGSFRSAFGALGKQALDGFAATLHNIMNDATHLVQLMTKIAEGDWAGAFRVLQEWKYGTPEERAANERQQQEAGQHLEDFAGRRAREEGGDWWYRLFNAPAVGESPTARFFNRARRFFGGQQQGEAVPTPSVGELGPIMNLVGRTEGTDALRGYNTVYGEGHHALSNQNLVGMTLDQIDDLQTRLIRTAGNSPVGRFQFNQETLRGLRGAHGLRGDMLFTPELQQMLFQWRVAQSGGPSVDNLRSIWPSLPGGSQDTHRSRNSELEARTRELSLNSMRTISPAAPTTVNPIPPRINTSPLNTTPSALNPPGFGGVNFHQDTNINIHGASDTSQVSAELERVQNRVNRDLIRNGRSALA